MTGHSSLPQLNGHLMTSASGFETWMQYVDGFTLRHFCGFELHQLLISMTTATTPIETNAAQAT